MMGRNVWTVTLQTLGATTACNDENTIVVSC